MDNRKQAYAVQAELDVRVSMRDGTALATDVFRPMDTDTREPISEPVPALLDRTPYGRRGRLERHGEYFASRGYVVAVQDCRGRGDSEGEFRPFVNDPEDGYDTVEWLADRSYVDGQVGTIGSSYGAWVQTGLAALDPPSLAAMFVNQGIADGWEAGLRHHGALELRWLSWMLTVGGGLSQAVEADQELEQRFANVDVEAILERGARTGQTPLRHLENYKDAFFELATAEQATGLFESPAVDFTAYYDDAADIPTVWSTGWYDSYTRAVCRNFSAMQQRSDSDQFLLVGPWTHGWDRYPQPAWSAPYAGDVAFGPAATREYQATRLAFFDRYLKELDRWDREPVEFFLMGTDSAKRIDGRRHRGGEWRTAGEWPPSGADTRTYHAHPDGALRESRPPSAGGATTYEFNPSNPVPTIGGNCSSYLSYEERSKSVLEYPLAERELADLTGRGGFHQATDVETFGASPPYGPLEQRSDVVVFRTPPLSDPVRLAGSVEVVLFVATDGPDTDFTAKLIDEGPPDSAHPERFACNLTDSICRLRYRNHARGPRSVDQGAVYEIRLELYPTANVFRTGHRIRLDISSSNFPRYDVNPNTGGGYGTRDDRVAENTLYHDRERPSWVELSVVDQS
jgi:putative CocE/NonD family hydrolase